MSEVYLDAQKLAEIISTHYNKITAVKYSVEEAPKNAENVGAAGKGELKAGYKGNKIIIYTDADIVHIVGDMKFMFTCCKKLTDIAALSNWDVSKVKDMNNAFCMCCELTDISALSNWNIKSATNLTSMFERCYKLSNVIPLRKWTVRNDANTAFMFGDCHLLMESITMDIINKFKINISDL